MNGALQVEFSSPALLSFFVGSSIIASASCFLIGINLINSKTKIEKMATEKTSTICGLNLISQVSAFDKNADNENDYDINNEKDKKKLIVNHAQ